MEKDRLSAFMDAVLAIIMTILVLELPKPETISFQGIWNLKSHYFCYSLSFFWLGTMWVNLHNEWIDIKKISKSVVWWSLILLFASSWIPYTISIVNTNPNNVVGQVFYGIAVFFVTFANVWLTIAVEKCHSDVTESSIKEKMIALRKKLYPDIAIKIIGMILTLTVYPMAMSFAVLIAMIWILLPISY